MAKIHDKYVIELKEVIKGYGNDPQVKDPLKFPCDYKFYEIDGVAICENSFKRMKQLEDVAIPKADYEARLKADMLAILCEIQLEIDEIPINADNSEPFRLGQASAYDKCENLIQQKINSLKAESEPQERSDKE